MALGKEAMETGFNIAKDVSAGQSIKSAAKRNVKKAGKRLATKTVKGIKNKMTSARNQGGGASLLLMSILKGPWVEYHPVSNITDSAPIEFNVAGTAEEYVDLSQTMLAVTAKITNPDNTNLAQEAPVGPVNLFLPSLFSQVDVMLNEKLVSQPSNTYPYRAMLESIMHYGKETKDSQLTQQLYYKDAAGKMDLLNPLLAGENVNEGLKKRHEFIVDSKVLSMLGPIYGDLFFQERLLLPGVDLKLKLNRSKDAFCLLSSNAEGNYKVKILSAALYVRRVKTNPSVMLNHAKMLEKANAKYPLNKVDVRSFTIPAGNMSFNKDNLFLGHLPNRIVVGFVDNDAYNGTYGKNPYNFKNLLLNYVGVTVDGESIPMKPLRPNFREGPGQDFIHAYNSLFMGSNRLFQDKGIDINREEYARGYTLFAFDLTPDLSDGCHLNLVKQGNLRLELQFDNPLPNTVNCLVYSESQGLIQIDRSRNVVYDYQG
ncbi:uncharacterized protein F54H12.2-like [Strongylocentrotus purpuratus]|uniref:Uncharacterized protein n=1 Tax=Strongylocentrotus purpuratus TaxID=7668 RepID=A0A7M7N574_STRPU|nr:uncharacterized protein F54H12.2-like [Strongylocentrotus purpuratus]